MQKMKKTIESTGTEFLICFTSRPSSSTSKTLMSPSHPATLSLSSSFSRRLRSRGSLKSAGAASPIFPSSRRKSAAAIDAAASAEPSSPKVTCIGQVKIKAKKKKIKNGSSKKKKISINRSRSVSEARLRKPVSICDALNCFVPSCGWSSCYYSTTTISGRKRGNEHEVLRRDDRIGKFVGLVVREEVEVVERREEKVLIFEENVEEDEQQEEGRVSVCIPPRNALLLMRCRSDPVRMAALSSRFWDSPAMRVQYEDEVEVVVEDDVKEDKEEEGKVGDAHVKKISRDEEDEVEKGVVVDEDENGAHVEEEEEKVVVVEEVDKDDGVILAVPMKDVEEKEEESKLIEEKVEEELREEVICDDEGEEVEIILRRSISCSVPKSQDFIKAKEGGRRRSFSYREKEKKRHSFSSEKESRRHSFCSEKEARRSSFEGRRWGFSIEKEKSGPKEKPIVAQSVEPTMKEEPMNVIEPKIDHVRESIKVEETRVVDEGEKKSRELPDCLLLMMYEPKLSMEVSKETWVCSTDFVHWRPQPTKPPNVEEKCEEVMNANANANAVPIPQQTASKPVQGVSPIEQKSTKNSAVGALPQAPYEHHFVLTRCKSEPGKSSARLVPDTCFWKSRHQPIGTAGLGF